MTTTMATHEIEFPLRLTSLPNERYGHWGRRHQRIKRDRNAAATVVLGHFRKLDTDPPPGPWDVELVRIAPRKLDDDNLACTFKGVRDGIADILLPRNRGNQSARWSDDSDGQISWTYTQEKGKPRQYGALIRITQRRTDE